MVLTKHAIERFQSRVTNEVPEIICLFIQQDLQNSTLLYRLNDIEKRRCNDITYVIDCSNPKRLKVVTLYINLD